MELHDLSRTGTRQPRTRVGRGRGSGKGKTSGRGHKGQKSRAGYSRKLGFEGGQMPLFRRLPKRGFKNPFRTVYVAVNVDRLEAFEPGATVAVDEIVAAGLAKGRDIKIKILGRGGDLSKALHVKAHAFSATAKAKIEAAGGSCDVLQ